MKIWLDDQLDDIHCPDRHTPVGWVGCKTALQAIRLLKSGKVTDISFDHDLGDNVLGNGYTVARYIEKQSYYGYIGKISWDIHSKNPIGRANIKSAMDSAEKYWNAVNGCAY